AQVGYGNGVLKDHISTDLSGLPGGPVDFSGSGKNFLGGIHAGYNYQVNRLVIGLDGSWSWTNQGTTAACDLGQGFSLVQIGGLNTCRQNDNVKGIGDVRARVGAAFDRVHLYLAGGYAAAQIHSSFDSVPVGQPNATLSADKISSGWTFGGGLEYALTDRLII